MSTLRRLAWLLLYWAAGVVALGLLGGVIRLLLPR